MRTPSFLTAGAALLSSACATNAPPRNTYPGNVASVYFCAVNLLEGDGYELQTERQQTDPDARIAILLRRNDAAYIYVVQAGAGHVYVEVRNDRFGNTWVPTTR